MKDNSRIKRNIIALSRNIGIVFCTMLISLMAIYVYIFAEKEYGQTRAIVLSLIVTAFLAIILIICNKVFDNYYVVRPRTRIIDAVEKLAQGDYSAYISRSGIPNEYSELAENINELAKTLRDSEIMKEDFISNVSHEIKTPLATIQGYASAILSEELSEKERQDYLKGIEFGTKKLTELITNILKLNKLEKQELTVNKKQYNLGEQLRKRMFSFDERFEAKGIEWEADIDDVYVLTDEELMEIVWNNLLSNALKFTPKGGSISVNVKKKGDFAVVSVKDSGCGISPEVGKRIFDKFYQGDASHSVEGNGLGLALVKRIINITKADISVKSKPNVGSEFIVKIQSVA